jgi:hypothetical protein
MAVRVRSQRFAYMMFDEIVHLSPLFVSDVQAWRSNEQQEPSHNADSGAGKLKEP